MESKSKNSALLVMDMQAAVLKSIPDNSILVGNTTLAIEHARRSLIPVIFVVVGFRKGAIEISPNNKGFMAAREKFANIEGEEFMQIDQRIKPAASNIKVIKRRVSAFTGSDLEVVLRSCAIEHLILAGVATGGVILSTLREAADKDYLLTVLSDCCADLDSEVHQLLTTKIFPRQAEVITTNEWRSESEPDIKSGRS